MAVQLSLLEAADFIAEEARQLAVLNLFAGVSRLNMEIFRADAAKVWQSAQTGWKPVQKGYQKRKPTTELGVLTGAWKAYRLMSKADVVLHDKKGNPCLEFWASNPTAKQKRIHKDIAGGKMGKPWAQYPQRPIDMVGATFTPGQGAVIAGISATDYQGAIAQLPLTGTGLNWRRIGRKGQKVGSVSRSGGAKLLGRYGRAMQ